MSRCALLAVCCTVLGSSAVRAADALPFRTSTEVFRDEDEDVVVFAVKLEQPFIGGEFETYRYLRLRSLDDKSFLVYPRETRFRQKHAEFHGRLSGEGVAKLKLSYEVVSENLDGSRKVDVREAELEVSIPQEPTGAKRLQQQWAREQNAHFAELLRYYPEETFFEYVLLQSRSRYGVQPPAFEQPDPSREEVEANLYSIVSGGLAVQQALQRHTLEHGADTGDRTQHIGTVRGPSIRSLDYAALLEKRLDEGVEPRTSDVARFVPEDFYVLQVNSVDSIGRLSQLVREWGGNLLQVFRVAARDHHLVEKYERQLLVDLDGLSKLFETGSIDRVAFTGSDFYLAEGTDVTLLVRLKKPEGFRAALDGWLDRARQRRPDVQVRSFHYRGHEVAARYTEDRMVSSFVAYHGDHAIVSNSHRSLRRIVDTITGKSPSLFDAADYRYVSTILTPSDDPNAAHLYGSDAFLRRLVGPAFKIAEKRRRQSFNNLVMLNNASMFHRLEHRRSPTSIGELIDGRFVDDRRIVCPGGGAYAYDVEHDTCTNSVYNRIKYLTPIAELTGDELLRVSTRERQEYERFRRRYEELYRGYHDPLAMRITTGDTTRIETCVLPYANGSLYRTLRAMVGEQPRPIRTDDVAKNAVASVFYVPGRERIGNVLSGFPGVAEAIRDEPTLTDLSWLGDRVSFHVCDDDSILEIDPTKLKPLTTYFPVSVPMQLGATALVTTTSLPVYATVDLEDEAKAKRLLDRLSSQIFLKRDRVAGFETRLDVYRVPAYREHDVHVLSLQWYALKVRLHVSVVKGRLVAATKADTLKQAIDAALAAGDGAGREAHAVVRLNLRAVDEMREGLRMYWNEKARDASHRNVMPLYNLVKLYDVPIERANELVDAKYGVTLFCPDGEYRYDSAGDQVHSSVYGNRRNPRQDLGPDDDSSFRRFLTGFDTVTLSLRFRDEALLATVEVERPNDAAAVADGSGPRVEE